jgi:translation elongation factor EF-G
MYGEHAWSGEFGVSVSREYPISMFSKFVLQQIWALYATDASAAQAKLSQLFPVAKCVLESAVQHMPSPEKAAETRSRLFLPDGVVVSADSVVYVVKHHPADLSLGCLLGDRVDDIRKLTGFVGISRVFRGCISLFNNNKSSQLLFDASSKKQVTIKNIFMLMGTSLVPVSRAVAGSVVALEFEQDLI